MGKLLVAARCFGFAVCAWRDAFGLRFDCDLSNLAVSWSTLPTCCMVRVLLLARRCFRLRCDGEPWAGEAPSFTDAAGELERNERDA